jgi:hypothetical protein
MKLFYPECFILCRETAGLRFVCGFCWGWRTHLSGHIEPFEPFSRGLFVTEIGSVWCRCPWTTTPLLCAKEYSAEPIKIESWMWLSFDDLLSAVSDLESMAIGVNPGGFLRFTSI